MKKYIESIKEAMTTFSDDKVISLLREYASHSNETIQFFAKRVSPLKSRNRRLLFEVLKCEEDEIVTEKIIERIEKAKKSINFLIKKSKNSVNKVQLQQLQEDLKKFQETFPKSYNYLPRMRYFEDRKKVESFIEKIMTYIAKEDKREL